MDKAYWIIYFVVENEFEISKEAILKEFDAQ